LSSPAHAAANQTPLTPLRFLERSAAVFPDRVAVIQGERRYTYREFGEQVQRLARALRLRIEPGDRVAFLSPNTAELLFAHFAVPLAGGVLVAINSRLSTPEVTYILEHCGAVILLADSELVGTAEAVLDAVPTLTEVVEVVDPSVSATRVSTSATAYDVLVAEGVERAGEQPLAWAVEDELQVISINYTSGTTGRPKGVMYTHRGAYLNALGETFHNGFTGATRYLWTLPMFHCNGWCTPWAVTQAAGTHVLLRTVRAELVWDAIDRLGITHLCGAPTVCTTIADAEQAHVVDHLRITTAGAPPAPTVIARLEELGIDVVHVYGLTEVYGPYSICEPQDEWRELPAAERAALLSRQGVGMVQAETVRVVDEGLVDVPADGRTLGEIVLRGNNVMLGYFRDPAATAAAFAGGWFHTGDLGVMHPDGYVQLKDRAKDIIISGGENISTVEVEQALLSHPGVADVAVIGVPDERWGERPRAFVVARDGQSPSTADLVAHVRTRLAGFKVPRDVVLVTTLPRSATGKVLKFELREKG
jgi:fatty-acyl-CoA synthase